MATTRAKHDAVTEGFTFWSEPSDEVVARLRTTPEGLTSTEAAERLRRYGGNLPKLRRSSGVLALLLSQFRTPIILILILAAGLSFFLGEKTDAGIVLTIILASGLLGFWQERGAADAVEKLLATVRVEATVLRDGKRTEIPLEEVVPGDIAVLSAGDSVPGDSLILETQDLSVDEAALTGETYPVEKEAGVLAPGTPLAKRKNTLYMGTHVVSGTAEAVVARTGRETEFGEVSERLRLRPPETDFERGVRRFGYLLMEVTLLLVIAVFAINIYFERPVLDSFLFSLALAVGLTPQLLPAVVSVNLAHGAKRMAQGKVIVRRLASIEDFGSMNVLCSDKTGTLTEGRVRLRSVMDVSGRESEKVRLFTYLNALYETGYPNPIDEAIRAGGRCEATRYEKLAEAPYDFVRKRLSVLISAGDEQILITKGAMENVLSVCSRAEMPDGRVTELTSVREEIKERFERLSGEGLRTLGLAYRRVSGGGRSVKDLEAEMTFLGFVVLEDPPKPGVVETVDHLRRLGCSLKMITGDSWLVAQDVAARVGLSAPYILRGSELHHLSDEALMDQVNKVDVFAEVEPNQKERVILALKKTGNVVGYIGDGVNDASALHAADVGISVEGAADVAKEAADIVLLEKDLEILVAGVREGRKTFANTLKYVFMATSANFGNMFSMAGASLFLPFLPLLPKQILLANLMTDLPEMTIAFDSVDSELIEEPRRWNIRFIRDFMITFGLVSSIFDYLTFGTLLIVLDASTEQFRTGWFMESVVSASMIVLVVRSRRPFFRSRPSRYLLAATLAMGVVVLVFPYTPLAGLLGFTPMPPLFVLVLGIIVSLYGATAEVAKNLFYAKVRS